MNSSDVEMHPTFEGYCSLSQQLTEGASHYDHLQTTIAETARFDQSSRKDNLMNDTKFEKRTLNLL